MPMPMLDTQTLQCFVEATRAESFREAARVVALSPAAFGQRIQRLEEQLGVALFRRTTRSVTTTQAALEAKDTKLKNSLKDYAKI